MKKIATILSLTALAWGLAMGSAFAQTQGIHSKSPSIATLNRERASRILGSEVVNTSGTRLGKVEDLLLNPRTERAEFAVVSEGGVAGIHSTYHIVPINRLKLNGQNQYVLNMSSERFAKAPSFNKDTWPSMYDRTWQTGVYRYYGVRPSWEGAVQGKTNAAASKTEHKTVEHKTIEHKTTTENKTNP